MAITLGTVDSAAGTVGLGNSSVDVTGGYTVDAGSDRLLIVGTAVFTSGRVITGVSYNSVALTEIVSTITTAGQSDNSGATMWYLLNPPAGNHALNIQTNGTNTGIFWMGISLYGVHQTTPIGTPSSNAQGSNVQPTISVSGASGDLILDVLYARNNPMTPGSGQTELAEQVYPSQPHTLAMSWETASGASTTMDWTVTTTFNWQTQVGVAIKPVAGAPGPNRRRYAYVF